MLNYQARYAYLFVKPLARILRSVGTDGDLYEELLIIYGISVVRVKCVGKI